MTKVSTSLPDIQNLDDLKIPDIKAEAQSAFENLPKPRLQSLNALLLQGAISKDDKMLEKAFSIQDPDLMRTSLLHLPEKQVIVIFKELISRIVNNPTRILNLNTWLSTLMIVRGDNLRSIPNLKEHLKPLFLISEQMAQDVDKMEMLKGKLELTIERVKEKQRNKPIVDPQFMKKMLETPMAIYDESGSEDNITPMNGDNHFVDSEDSDFNERQSLASEQSTESEDREVMDIIDESDRDRDSEYSEEESD